MKKLTILFLLLALLLCGCGAEEIPEGPAELWVVTELTDDYGMNDQAQRMIEKFNELYPEVTVKLDILPTDKEERAVYLSKLRTQIMGGGGPDAYLLPTHNVVPDETSIYGSSKLVTPLFRDPELSMFNGVFYDIEKFYQADEELDRDALNQSVMDGVMVEGSRYVLPLRYNFGIYAVDPENFAAAGGDTAVFESGYLAVMEMAVRLENEQLANAAALGWAEYCFSEYVDYATEEVLLPAEELVTYFTLSRECTRLANEADMSGYCSGVYNIVENRGNFTTAGFPMVFSYLNLFPNTVYGAALAGESVEIYPKLASNGNLNAKVEYYAAVGAGAEYPRLAYEFIKLFLSEEAQFETYALSRSGQKMTSHATEGWPVRAEGSLEARMELLRTFTNRTYKQSNKEARAEKLMHKEITFTQAQQELPFQQVDRVIFPTVMESGDSLASFESRLYDSETGEPLQDIDLYALAEEYLQRMRLYIQEG